MGDVVVRSAVADDVVALSAIRRHYTLRTHAVFSTEPLTDAEVAVWVRSFDENSPHQLVVAEEAGVVTGYASTTRYRPSPAFDRSCELSIYLSPERLGSGTGTRLYAGLLPRAVEHGARTFLAGVALPNEASVAFHLRQGFREVGTFRDYAEKRGTLISSTWFQRTF
ncbi:GNAT family N-acetyltransferase [Nocardioides sp. W7]|uniref:GNAT family N-acetyltransferase n=1 Tax=Nocardioides sp. W7 TaxID=2931390 RepID=UPI001FD43681|nr:GNAT family N-acetyltransferase [Nocardioides sp. W7]